VKKNWSHELKRASIHLRSIRFQVKRQTLNHWHGRLGTNPLCYQSNSSWVTKRPLYWNCVMLGGMAE